MFKHEREDFRKYLRQCTDNQVRGVYEKEREAGRRSEMALCRAEASRRSIELPRRVRRANGAVDRHYGAQYAYACGYHD